MINPSISNIASGDPENPTPKVTFQSGDVTSDRIVTFPDQSLEVAGTEATQIFKNKDYADARFADATDVTKRILFDLSALPGATILRYAFPHQLLNVSLGNNNTLVTELAQQVIDNKTIRSLKLVDEENDQNQIHFDLSNIEGTKSISFPNASATLLSTENVGTLGADSYTHLRAHET